MGTNGSYSEPVSLEDMEETKEEVITITKKEHTRLLKIEKTLQALEGAGVDNWDGYDVAIESLNNE
jgi:hypothetical protein